jgi:hypothetical protein
VLLVRTDQGGLVLDSNASNILHWTSTGYRYVKRQQPGDPNAWVYIDGDSSHGKPVPTVAAPGPMQAAPQPKRSPATAVGIKGPMSPG